MADRRAIREAVYGEMEDAVSSLSFIGADDISQDHPDTVEDLPRVIHADDYRERPLNQASSAPYRADRDADGNVLEVTFLSFMEGVFSATIMHDDESEKEDAYEALRRQFERYEHEHWDGTDIHADVHEVNVRDASSTDDTDRSPAARADRLQIDIGYERDYRVVREDLAGTNGYEDFDGTFSANVGSVESLIDLDGDGAEDITTTTQ